MTRRAPSRDELLEQAARRVAENQGFLASALRDWGGGRLDLDALASFLGCSREAVVRAALCRRPNEAGNLFRTEISRVAAHSGVNETRLLELLRQASSLEAFRKSDGTQVLAAARDDRDRDEDDES